MIKKVLITGGNGDIAKAITRELESKGGFEVKAPGRDELDVTDTESAIRYMERYIPDILVNNAGYVVPTSVLNCDIESEKKAIDVNLYGVFNCTAAVLKKNPAALIINIGSSAATKVHGAWAAYCAAKAGVVMATKCWAEEGCNVICISPGRAATKMRRSLFPDEDQETLLKPEDFAKVVMNGVEGKYQSGQHINVTRQNVKELLM